MLIYLILRLPSHGGGGHGDSDLSTDSDADTGKAVPAGETSYPVKARSIMTF